MGSGLVNGGDYFYNNLSFTVTRYNGIMATDSTQCVKKSRGRPKVFDRDAALDKAMKRIEELERKNSSESAE